MSKDDNNFSHFLKTLNSLQGKNHNPFDSRAILSYAYSYDMTAIFGFYEDLITQEVRCPICLQRTKFSTKPSNCEHIFCNYCIKKWSRQSNKCPICRKLFTDLKKIDISSSNVSFQGDLFIK